MLWIVAANELLMELYILCNSQSSFAYESVSHPAFFSASLTMAPKAILEEYCISNVKSMSEADEETLK